MNTILLLIIFLSLAGVTTVYGQNQQRADVIFTTSNASIPLFDEHDFNVIINNMPSNKEICKSGNCSIEIIKLSENELPTGIVSIPDPTTQNMNSGVDIRIHDAANDRMPEMEREFQERWSIWGNCEIADIKATDFICGHETYDTITLSNKFQNIEIMLPLIDGRYDTDTDKMIFLANFK